jgi:hypothetical protein
MAKLQQLPASEGVEPTFVLTLTGKQVRLIVDALDGMLDGLINDGDPDENAEIEALIADIGKGPQ